MWTSFAEGSMCGGQGTELCYEVERENAGVFAGVTLKSQQAKAGNSMRVQFIANPSRLPLSGASLSINHGRNTRENCQHRVLQLQLWACRCLRKHAQTGTATSQSHG